MADLYLWKWDIDALGDITRALVTWPAGHWVSSLRDMDLSQ